MQSCAVIKVTIEDEDQKLTKEFLSYEPFLCDPEDQVLSSYIHQVRQDFKGLLNESEIKITIKMVL